MIDNALILQQVLTSATVRLPGITDDLMVNEMRWVLHDFLRRTGIHARDVVIYPRLGARDYEVALEYGESITHIVSAERDGFQMRIGNLTGTGMTLGSPSVVGVTSSQKIRLWPVPSTDDEKAIVIRLALTLSPDEDWDVPDSVDPYQHVLLDGLLYRCFSMPDKPWSSLALASTHLALYRSGLAEARAATRTGRVFGGQAWRFPRFGR